MWWTGSAIGFDLETDGRDPTDARIITAATVNVAPGVPPITDEVMLKPERPIPEEASAIHGISTDMAEVGGMPRTEGVRYIATRLMMAGPDVPVVGHNACYDLTVVDREMRRTGVGHLSQQSGLVRVHIDGEARTASAFPVIDTYVLDKAVDRYRRGRRQLSHVAQFYGVPMAEGAAHGATADVLASLRIAWVIAKRAQMASVRYDMDLHKQVIDMYADRKYPEAVARSFSDLGQLTLGELHSAQIQWATEQASGLREHFTKNPDKGDPNDVDGSWPVRRIDDDRIEDVTTTLI
jgi:DNA polymerase-3 subunit epsilon